MATSANPHDRPVHRIAIVGGGFGGLYAARHLNRAAAEITLIDRRNLHLFQPLLYQVATGALSPANIAAPLRALVRRQRNTRVIMAEVVGLNVQSRQLRLRDGVQPYDTLILATGSTFNYFGHDEWAGVAPGLKTIEDAITIRHKILSAFEQAERATSPDAQKHLLTFAIVGGGPTGVEMAGALAEVARHTLRRDFRRIDPASARIVLIEAGPRVLHTFPKELSQAAHDALVRMNVEVKTGTAVSGVAPDRITVRAGSETYELRASTILWTAGVKASPLGRIVATAAGAEVDPIGRIVVQADLTIPGHPEIFVIGDLAHAVDAKGHALPGLALVAMQQGRYVAGVITSRLRNRRAPGPFVYRNFGIMATIGRSSAVADLGWVRFTGTIAWLLWLFVHLINIVQFQNRVLVLVQWAWSYFTRNRSARLITEEPLPAVDTGTSYAGSAQERPPPTERAGGE